MTPINTTLQSFVLGFFFSSVFVFLAPIHDPNSSSKTCPNTSVYRITEQKTVPEWRQYLQG